MEITDEMVDAALLAYWGRRSYTTLAGTRVEQPWTPQQVESMRAALTAALPSPRLEQTGDTDG